MNTFPFFAIVVTIKQDFTTQLPILKNMKWEQKKYIS